MTILSTPRAPSDPILNTQYNDLRTDLLNHVHDGSETQKVSSLAATVSGASSWTSLQTFTAGIAVSGGPFTYVFNQAAQTSISVTNNSAAAGAVAAAQFLSDSSRSLFIGTASAGYVAPFASKSFIQSNAAALLLQNNNNGQIQFYVGPTGTVLAGYVDNSGSLQWQGHVIGAGNGQFAGIVTAGTNGSSFAGTTIGGSGLVVSASGITCTGGINILTAGLTVGGGGQASFTGRVTMTGNIAGAAGSMYKDAAGGLVLWGVTGSSYDFTLLNNAGAGVFSVLAGSTNTSFTGLMTVNGTGASSYVLTLQNSTATGFTSIHGLNSSSTHSFFVTSYNPSAAGNNSFGVAAASTFEVATPLPMYVGTYAATSLSLGTSGAVRATIASTGAFGIGAAPSGTYLLEVNQNQNGPTQIGVVNGNTGASALSAVALSSTTLLYLGSASSGYAAPYTSKGFIQSNSAAGLMFQNNNNGPIQFYVGAGTTLAWYVEGTNGRLFAGTDNTFDIGASGALRPRSVYVGTAIAIGATPASGGDIRLINGFGMYSRNAGGGDENLLSDLSGTVVLGSQTFSGKNTLIQAPSNGQVQITTFGNTGIKVYATGGVTVGTPSGGDKGGGAINAATVWRNGTALDHVFEPDYDLLSIPRMRSFYEEHHYLPTLRTGDVHDSGSTDMGALTDKLWETVEVHARYVSELHDRLAVAEAKLASLGY